MSSVFSAGLQILSWLQKVRDQSQKCALDCGRRTRQVRGRKWLHRRVTEGAREKRIRINPEGQMVQRTANMVVVGLRDSHNYGSVRLRVILFPLYPRPKGRNWDHSAQRQPLNFEHVPNPSAGRSPLKLLILNPKANLTSCSFPPNGGVLFVTIYGNFPKWGDPNLDPKIL